MALALLVAAGSGERLGAGVPKAFVPVGGRPLLEWSVAAMRRCGAVEEIVVALPEGHAAPDGTTGVRGGATRSESVRAALAAGAATADGAVVVHDAARPLATPELFGAVVAALEEGWDGAIAAARATDTIKEVAPGDVAVLGTPERARLWAVQTPQAFRRSALERALAAPPDVVAAATDDAWLVERTGGRVRVVESPGPNLKVTTPTDLRVAELLLC